MTNEKTGLSNYASVNAHQRHRWQEAIPIGTPQPELGKIERSFDTVAASTEPV